MKKFFGKILRFYLVFSIFLSLNGCKNWREPKTFSDEELQCNLICIEIVRFGWKDGQEINNYEAWDMGLKEYEVYEVYKILDDNQMISITKELSSITFEPLFGPPQSLMGYGIVLKYPDKSYYISDRVIEEVYEDGTIYCLYHSADDSFINVINKYVDDLKTS